MVCLSLTACYARGVARAVASDPADQASCSPLLLRILTGFARVTRCGAVNVRIYLARDTGYTSVDRVDGVTWAARIAASSIII